MAIKLTTKQNTDPAVYPWPYGKIRDNSGPNDGTPVNTQVYGDYHQFFAVLLQNGSIVANDLPENSNNSFQYSLALANIPKIQTDFFHVVALNFLQPPYQNSFAASTINSTTGAAYKKLDRINQVSFQGAFQRATELNGSTVFTLPINYRPMVNKIMPILMYNNSTYKKGVLKIDYLTGNVTVDCEAGDGTTLATYIIDGLMYSLD